MHSVRRNSKRECGVVASYRSRATRTMRCQLLECYQFAGRMVRQGKAWEGRDRWCSCGGPTSVQTARADTHQLLGDLAAEAEGWDSALAEYQQALKLLSTCPDVKARPVTRSLSCCTRVLLTAVPNMMAYKSRGSRLCVGCERSNLWLPWHASSNDARTGAFSMCPAASLWAS